ncbi:MULTISPECIES: hypothetical protein [Klebsiella]|uniref:hypothetical protein n=1 Tax=Klebsiella TaxID=570 RepID=UPI001D0D4EB5|nr:MULTISPECIES: hypothetical protein [Klebsiella]MDS7888476.1 hypothetical protein [Klebsiella michiganensis]MDS7895784.1 hypothetical protein [Klebsiella michiganensis]MDU3204463.1 hypothetical protein [Klebsiella sp.]MDV0363043.1 hypothetical protein [Klebsiella michiganensis]UON97867.1 hypothetical protein MT472_08150 [Klebsiella michiganensis]
MTKSTITREQAQQIIDAADEVITALAGTNDEVHKDDTDKMVRLWDDLNDRHAPPEVVRELARMALSAMDSEPVAWGNGCDKTVPAALRYLAENERPFGGESRFNAAHLYQLAREIELMAEDPLYRHAQPAPVVPEDIPDSVYEILCQACGGKAWMYEEALWNACRAAMLQAGTLTNEDTRQVDELTMWIKRLVRSLKNANPDSKLPRETMDYLTAKGLISVGDILR